MKLILTPFQKAVATLERALAAPVVSMDDFSRELHRDAVIQRFEYTYELAWKFMRRTIRDIDKTATDDLLTKKDLFRKALEFKLIPDAATWINYHDARNLTSHAYDENIAKQVFEAAISFVQDVRTFLTLLEDRYGK